MFVSIANAAAASPEAGGGNMLAALMPILLMFVIFYFLLIRPQQKRSKQHQQMLKGLQKGDHVLTTGGLLGRVVEVENDIFTIDLGSTTVRVPRNYISSTYDPKMLGKDGSGVPSPGSNK